MYDFELDLKTLRTMRHQNQDSEAVGILAVLLAHRTVLLVQLGRFTESDWYDEGRREKIWKEREACEDALVKELDRYFLDGREQLRAAETIRKEA